MTVKEVRTKYLEFFQKKGHTVIPSSSLIPENDPTTLFTGSGMQPMVPFLLGERHPAGNKLVDSQKCFRSGEFEEVGDNRHTTFFEMLGNWSLGDYFKEEQIPWIFTFLTDELGLDPNKLYITAYRGNEKLGLPRDTQAVELWKQEFENVNIHAGITDLAEINGIKPGERIFYYPDDKNWWSRTGIPEKMPIGEPGGPDSEIFYDFGDDLHIHEKSKFKDEVCHVNCDCGRFMEIGNSVFMMYIKSEEGFKELPNKNIDFGGGLERMTAAVNGYKDIFDIDIFQPLKIILEKVSGKKYGVNESETYAFRIIMDHLRAATFLIADGVLPSNKDQGYFVRRLLRRAIRYANELSIKDNFAGQSALEIINKYNDTYPNLKAQKDIIIQEIDEEETKFRKTLEKGLKEFEKVRNGTNGKFISGIEAFNLYQTYGFPIEMILEIAQKEGIKVDVEGFETEFKRGKQKHQEISRAGVEQKFKGGLADHSEETKRLHTATHLLQAALRKVLGDHVAQKGSNITKERLRFDFSHPQKMTPEEIKLTEDLVNQAISKDYQITWEEMTPEEAKERKAIGLFGEKYGSKVKVYTIGDPLGSPEATLDSLTFSREICGGPHVTSTGQLGKIKIIKEEAVSAGIRRIKAILN